MLKAIDEIKLNIRKLTDNCKKIINFLFIKKKLFAIYIIICLSSIQNLYLVFLSAVEGKELYLKGPNC